jgi:hypothetical protein
MVDHGIPTFVRNLFIMPGRLRTVECSVMFGNHGPRRQIPRLREAVLSSVAPSRDAAVGRDTGRGPASAVPVTI